MFFNKHFFRRVTENTQVCPLYLPNITIVYREVLYDILCVYVDCMCSTNS